MRKLKLWRISPAPGKFKGGYDTYDEAVVAAYTEDEARRIHPSGHRSPWDDEAWPAVSDHVKAQCIGIAESDVLPDTVIVASFQAG